MANFKRVYLSKVENEGTYSFERFLKNVKFHKIVEMNDKRVEISHIHVEKSYITALFVSTQESGIAPIHKPGDEEDYSAVPIPDGKGFAYPNVFIYLPELDVLAWESNRSGQAEKGMEYYFNTIADYNKLDMKVSFNPIMNADAFNRISNLFEVNKIDLQIAAPTVALRGEVGRSGAFADIKSLVEDVNATKVITISVAADEKKEDKLNKQSIIALFHKFIPLQENKLGHVKNKMLIKGKQRGDDGRLVEETINIVLNRYEDRFHLDRLKIAPHLQIQERKEGIIGAILSKIDVIKKLL